MNRWYTSDTHFGHPKLLRDAYRSFGDLAAMNEALVDAWNDVVAPGDEVWVLGDFAVPATDDNLAYGAKLNGRKVLVPGNHDRCWRGGENRPRLMLREQMRYRHIAGFDEILDSPEPHSVGGELVQLSHFPFSADHTDPPRFLDRRPSDNGGWLLHGHIHEMWLQYDKQINVGVDAWQLRPAHVDEIASLISAGRQYLQALPSPHLGLGAIKEIDGFAQSATTVAIS